MKRITASNEERIEWLSACSLFSEMPSDLILAVAKVSSVRLYEAGEALFHEGAKADGLHIVLDGQVKVCRYGFEGREQILHIFEGVEPCGEVAMFEGGAYPASAEALAPSKTLFIPRPDFLHLAEKRPDLLLNMLAILSRRLRRFVEMIDNLSLKEVSTRLSQYLLDLSENSGGAQEFELPVSKTMLAAQIGTVAETLSRTLARMQRRGLIDVESRRVVLRNRGALEKIAGGEKL